MNKDLRNISGTTIPAFPFKLNKIGDLIYFEGSLMAVYQDSENNPYIFDWVEANNELNRWLVYQVNKESLYEYISGNLTHLSLINNPINDILFLVDKNANGHITNCKIITPKNIPYEYLPKSNIKFEEEDSKNLFAIKETFKFEKTNDFPKEELIIFNILEEAKKNDSELINLHIKSKDSTKVGFGKIRSSILGAVLTNYSKLSEATAINLYDDKGKLPENEKIRRRHGELESIKTLGETEFIYAKAASFSVFLKPLKQKIDLFDNITSSEKITQAIFNLFEASEDSKNLEEIKDSINDSILISYNNMLREIKEQDIVLSIQYANPNNSTELTETFDATKATKILKNLDILEVEKSSDHKAKGIFKALDSISYTFKFETLEGDIYEGKFSDQLKLGISEFNLREIYQATIEIQKIKNSGKKNLKERITLVSCVPISD